MPVLPEVSVDAICPPQTDQDWLVVAGGQKLFYRRWQGKPGAPVIIYLHGIEGHSQWFARTAAQLAASGMTVYAPDRRGAGMNQTERGHLSSYKQLMSDLVRLMAMVRAQNQHEPIFLIGNCWGAQAAILLAHDCQVIGKPLAGLILTSPALTVKCDLDLLTKLKIGFSWLTGSLRTFAIPLTPEMFTDNPPYLNYVRQDPLRLTAATASFFIETLKLRAIAKRTAEQLRLPFLLLQAQEDPIVDVGAVKKWFEQLPMSDKTWKLYEGAKHSLDFESDSGDYFLTLRNWISARQGGESV